MLDNSEQDLLKLQRMEMSLIRAHIAHPGILSEVDYQRLRYLLGFARLNRFVPGAAMAPHAGAEVELAADIVAPVRELTLRSLFNPLRKSSSLRLRLEASAAVLPPLHAAVTDARSRLLKRHENEFSADLLDAECGRKALVTAMGGGGGAGYVYVGAAARLHADNVASDYIAGASIGALLGALLARSSETDIDGLMAWAKQLTPRSMFSQPYAGVTHSLPGLLRLHLHAMHKLLATDNGEPLRLEDLEIPYDAVVAGVRTKMYNRLPASLRENRADFRSRRFSRQVAERFLQLTAFINPGVVQAIPLGRDPATRKLRVVDAVGLSAAIPGILQYEPPVRDKESDAILAELRRATDSVVFVDGGVASNVPARIAWQGVQAGRIGTRNAFYLALDCFQPQWDSRHLWLAPVQQLVQLQLPPQRPYFDWLMSFSPTLSPVNLLPNAAQFDMAYQWGWQQADAMMPFLRETLKPALWHQ